MQYIVGLQFGDIVACKEGIYNFLCGYLRLLHLLEKKQFKGSLCLLFIFNSLWSLRLLKLNAEITWYCFQYLFIHGFVFFANRSTNFTKNILFLRLRPTQVNKFLIFYYKSFVIFLEVLRLVFYDMIISIN